MSQTATSLRNAEVPSYQQTGLATTPYSWLDQSRVDVVKLDSINQRILVLRKREENWDGFGSAKPDPGAVSRARSFLHLLYNLVTKTRYGWYPPLVNSSEEGEVVFEWWHGDRKLTIYCGVRSAQFIKVWGADIKNEMDDGPIETEGDLIKLWHWLFA